MSFEVLQGDARNLPLDDDSVDLIVTSPPYFALRSYRDDGEHYDGQIGSEPTPSEFLDALIECTGEMVRVLKPSGSIFVNLGDKYANPAASGNTGKVMGRDNRATYGGGSTLNAGIPQKSRMLLPHRYAIRCIDELGLICRMDMVWSKPNGLPESVTDRVRASHEYWFHLVKSPRYFTGIDEIRQSTGREATWSELESARDGPRWGTTADDLTTGRHRPTKPTALTNPLGRLPGSVWDIPSEPLLIPDSVREAKGLPDHFAAFPQEWPRRLILGFSPTGICTECEQPRRAVVEKVTTGRDNGMRAKKHGRSSGMGSIDPEFTRIKSENPDRLVGYACKCGSWETRHVDGDKRPDGKVITTPKDYQVYVPPPDPAPTRPAVVLDPFGGTGTTAGVAHTLGRHGITVDLSADYCRLAEWRITESGHFDKSRQRMWRDRQTQLL